MDDTINNLLGDQTDFDFYDDHSRDKKSSNSSSDDEMNCIKTPRKKHYEVCKSSTDITEDEDIKSFNSVNNLFIQLENNLKKFKSLPEIKLIDKYSKELKRKLDQELEDLDFTMKETKATILNTQRLKKQRYYVKKELAKMTKNLAKVKQEELQEMELVVAVYDKELLRRWHVAKKTTSPHALEGFINNIVGKRQAVDNVYKMAKDRLEVLKKSGNQASLPALTDIFIQARILNEDEEEEEIK